MKEIVLPIGHGAAYDLKISWPYVNFVGVLDPGEFEHSGPSTGSSQVCGNASSFRPVHFVLPSWLNLSLAAATCRAAPNSTSSADHSRQMNQMVSGKLPSFYPLSGYWS